MSNKAFVSPQYRSYSETAVRGNDTEAMAALSGNMRIPGRRWHGWLVRAVAALEDLHARSCRVPCRHEAHPQRHALLVRGVERGRRHRREHPMVPIASGSVGDAAAFSSPSIGRTWPFPSLS